MENFSIQYIEHFYTEKTDYWGIAAAQLGGGIISQCSSGPSCGKGKGEPSP